jgi:protoporphyrinogen IX oxidase
MLWLKAFHIVFVVTWFAGLFYLPRLYLYHVSTQDPTGIERFKIMEKRLFTMMTIGATLAATFGIAMIIVAPSYLQAGWMHAKLTWVVGLLIYHFWCYRLLVAIREGRNRHSERWYRLFNEVPTLFLIAIVILVVVKPF